MIRTRSQKIIGILLTAALLLSLTAVLGVPAQADSNPFADVPSGKWYTDAVEYCYEQGYVGGYEDKTFRPDNKLTRAEMSVIMNKMLGLKDGAENTFSDVAAGKWYTDPILHCVKAGVMTGYSSTQFGTTDTLTREQGAVILAKAFGVDKADGRTTFADDKSISNWAAGSVKAMAARGLISGMGNNQFGPKTPLTRAQMCQIIYAAKVKDSGEENPKEDTPKPSEKVTPTEPEVPEESIRTGDVEETTTTDTWEEAYLNYLNENKMDSTAVTLIDVDGDEYDEVVVHYEIGAGNDEILTYHDGKISKLPLNGAAVGYLPGKNQMMVAEYGDGTYYLSIYIIENGTWKITVSGSYTDPAGGPALDEEGYDIYENYKWNGKDVTEVEFYTALGEAADIENFILLEG